MVVICKINVCNKFDNKYMYKNKEKIYDLITKKNIFLCSNYFKLKKCVLFKFFLELCVSL